MVGHLNKAIINSCMYDLVFVSLSKITEICQKSVMGERRKLLSRSNHMVSLHFLKALTYPVRDGSQAHLKFQDGVIISLHSFNASTPGSPPHYTLSQGFAILHDNNKYHIDSQIINIMSLMKLSLFIEGSAVSTVAMH